MPVTFVRLTVGRAVPLLLALLGGVLCTAFIAFLIAVYPLDASVTGVADRSSRCAFPEYQELVRGGHELEWLVASKSAGDRALASKGTGGFRHRDNIDPGLVARPADQLGLLRTGHHRGIAAAENRPKGLSATQTSLHRVRVSAP